MVWMASRMLMIRNRYNQTGGSDAFLRMFSCAGVIVALVLVGAGLRSRGQEKAGWGDWRGWRVFGWLRVRFEVI